MEKPARMRRGLTSLWVRQALGWGSLASAEQDCASTLHIESGRPRTHDERMRGAPRWNLHHSLDLQHCLWRRQAGRSHILQNTPRGILHRLEGQNMVSVQAQGGVGKGHNQRTESIVLSSRRAFMGKHHSEIPLLRSTHLYRMITVHRGGGQHQSRSDPLRGKKPREDQHRMHEP